MLSILPDHITKHYLTCKAFFNACEEINYFLQCVVVDLVVGINQEILFSSFKLTRTLPLLASKKTLTVGGFISF